MKNNSEQPNRIRPSNPAIRVVRPRRTVPTPSVAENNHPGGYYFIYTMIFGLITFYCLKYFLLIETLLSQFTSWKRHALEQTLWLALVFVLPLIIHLLLNPQIMSGITLTNRNGTWFGLTLIALLAGFPLGLVAGSVQTILTLLFAALGANHEAWLSDSALAAYDLTVRAQQITYLLIVCIIPACLSELALRGVHYAQLIRRNRYFTALLYASVATPLVMSQKRFFVAYLIFGLFACFLYNQSQSILPSIAAHLSFNLMYRLLIHREEFLRLFPVITVQPTLESVVPAVIKGLLAACIFVPLYALASHLNKRDPLTESEEIVRSHLRPNRRLSFSGKILLPGMLLLAALYFFLTDL